MSMRVGRLAALVMGIVSVLALSGGVASAAAPRTIWEYNDGGPWPTQAICNAHSAAANDPPDVYTSPCNYYTSRSQPNNLNLNNLAPRHIYPYAHRNR